MSPCHWIDFRAVKAAVSMEAVLRHYDLPNLRRQRGQLQGPCPIHRGQRQDSFRVSLTKNVFQCFSCQAKGSVLDLVAALECCSVRAAALRLADCFGLTTPPQSPLSPGVRPWLPSPLWNPETLERVRKKEERNPVLGFRLWGVDGAHPYLRQRGIERTTALKFGVGWYSGPGLMRRRIVIPIENERGEIVAYAGRALGAERPKYLLPPGFQKGRELFNLHRALATGEQAVIVVEGYFDCMKVHQAGFPNVVALMGCSLSLIQMRSLQARFQRVLLMLDGDAAGQQATPIIGYQLHHAATTISSSIIPVPDGKQPDQLSSLEIHQLLMPLKARA